MQVRLPLLNVVINPFLDLKTLIDCTCIRFSGINVLEKGTQIFIDYFKSRAIGLGVVNESVSAAVKLPRS